AKPSLRANPSTLGRVLPRRHPCSISVGVPHLRVGRMRHRPIRARWNTPGHLFAGVGRHSRVSAGVRIFQNRDRLPVVVPGLDQQSVHLYHRVVARRYTGPPGTFEKTRLVRLRDRTPATCAALNRCHDLRPQVRVPPWRHVSQATASSRPPGQGKCCSYGTSPACFGDVRLSSPPEAHPSARQTG
ncbi:hypothetical protein LCGC14_2248030, partial [marine sediment metagenome]